MEEERREKDSREEQRWRAESAAQRAETKEQRTYSKRAGELEGRAESRGQKGRRARW